jgi:hypothetical protein
MTAAAEAALFATIWVSLGLFVAGELRKRRAQAGSASLRSGWTIWAAGALLCGIHIVLAFALRHGWSHRSAFEATARQTHLVYGINWGGGLYVNFVFLGAWLGEVAWWRWNPRRYFGKSNALTWLFRGFYFVILANATIVFAPQLRRLYGVALLAILVWAWRPLRRA